MSAFKAAAELELDVLQDALSRAEASGDEAAIAAANRAMEEGGMGDLGEESVEEAVGEMEAVLKGHNKDLANIFRQYK